MENHNFWKTQPVLETEIISESDFGPIETPKLESIKMEPYNLPDGFEFYTLDLKADEDILKVQTFLNNNYLEADGDNMRFAYSIETIKWITMCPNYFPELFICVRTKNNKQIIATIFGIPVKVKVFDKIIEQVEIDLLCVSKKFRNKRLAPVMIKEVTRRTNLRGIFQAVYTAGLELPNKLSTIQYYHRIISVKKMESIGFYELPNNNFSLYEKFYKVKIPKLDNSCIIRPFELKDVDICLTKLNKYLMQYKLTHVFDKDGFIHYFMPKNNVVYTYVVEKDNIVTDMISFFIIDNTISNNAKYNEYKAGYLYYYFNESLKLEDLLDIGFYYAKTKNIDVFNILNMFDLNNAVEKCKFLPGNGYLNYYLYNYKCNPMNTNEVAFPMF
jgi:glycylpeptide N-tetradecanoyltransferase